MENEDFDILSDRIEAAERRHLTLSEDQLGAIAEAAAKRALELVYAEVGKSAVRLALWVIGAGVLALLAWLGLTGKALK